MVGRWSPTLGDGGCSCFGDFRALAAFGIFRKYPMALATVGWDVFEEIASEVCDGRIKGRRGYKRPETDLGERAGKPVRGNVLQLRNTAFMVVIRWVPNGNNDQTSSNELWDDYTDVRHWEELIDFIKKNCCPNKPYYLTAIFKCNLMPEGVDEEYMTLYAPGQMITDPLYRQIWYNCSLWNAFKLKLGHNVKLFDEEMKAVTGKDNAEHVMRMV